MKTTPVKINMTNLSQFLGEAVSKHFAEEAAKLVEKDNEKKKPA